MEWYLKVLRQYADFEGRARRKEYWMFTLMNIIIQMLLFGIITVMQIPELFFLLLVYGLAVFIPSLAVVVRRLHDLNKSGFYFFIGLIPFVGGIILLVWFATEGTKGPNQYGPDPKGNTPMGDETVLDSDFV